MIKVGVSKEKISPKMGTLLAGYPWERRANGIADDLDVSVIALKNEKEKALLISATLTEVYLPILEEIKAEIDKRFGVKTVIFCSTHTHSGPVLFDLAGWGSADIEYKDTVLLPKTLIAVETALSNMQNAKVGVGCTDSLVGVNRREIRADGKVYLGENPDGIMDTKMYVVSFVSENNQPICNLVHYAAHGTCVTVPDDLWVTRDWPGVMVDMLEDKSGAVSVFFNGAEGDIAPRKIPGMTYNLEMMREVGKKAGNDAIRAYNSILEYKDVDLKTVFGTVKLSYDELISEEVALEELNKLGDDLDGEHQLEKQKWLDVINAHKQEKKTHMSFEQVVLSVGDVAFVPFPFEPFTEIAVNLAKQSPFKYTLSLSNANGCNGYLPSSTEIPKGGYEIWEYKHGRAYVLTDNADKEIVQENLKLLNELKKL